VLSETVLAEAPEVFRKYQENKKKKHVEKTKRMPANYASDDAESERTVMTRQQQPLRRSNRNIKKKKFSSSSSETSSDKEATKVEEGEAVLDKEIEYEFETIRRRRLRPQDDDSERCVPHGATSPFEVEQELMQVDNYALKKFEELEEKQKRNRGRLQRKRVIGEKNLGSLDKHQPYKVKSIKLPNKKNEQGLARVHWKKDGKGFQPNPSYIDLKDFALKYPLLLCDYLEKNLKFEI